MPLSDTYAQIKELVYCDAVLSVMLEVLGIHSLLIRTLDTVSISSVITVMDMRLCLRFISAAI